MRTMRALVTEAGDPEWRISVQHTGGRASLARNGRGRKWGSLDRRLSARAENKGGPNGRYQVPNRPGLHTHACRPGCVHARPEIVDPRPSSRAFTFQGAFGRSMLADPPSASSFSSVSSKSRKTWLCQPISMRIPLSFSQSSALVTESGEEDIFPLPRILWPIEFLSHSHHCQRGYSRLRDVSIRNYAFAKK